MMPSEAEQIQNIETQAESVQPSAFSIDDTEISRALRSGSGYSGGKLRIAAAFATIGDSKERADFLKKEYGTGGRSWDFIDGSRGFVDYDSKGILIKSWEYKLTVKLKWPEVEKRIGKLVESGEYLTAPEKERFAALEEEYAGRGGIPTPNPAFVYPPAQVEEFHSDNPRMDAMMNFAAQVAVENDYAEPQRFTVVDTPDGHFQIRDSIHDGIYTEQDGTQRVFDDEESADQYMQEITEEAQRQSAEDWLALERAKLPPQALLSDTEFAQQYLIPGETQLEMEGRQFLIDRVNLESKTVNLQDIRGVQHRHQWLCLHR